MPVIVAAKVAVTIRNSLSTSVARPRALDRRQHFVLRWKAERSLLCDPLFSDPHGIFAPRAFDQLGLDANLLLDERRRTGSARKIISNLAVSNADVFHQVHSPAT
jgi:hypothetical protein